MRYEVYKEKKKVTGVCRLRLVPQSDGSVELYIVNEAGNRIDRGTVCSISRDGIYRHSGVAEGYFPIGTDSRIVDKGS